MANRKDCSPSQDWHLAVGGGARRLLGSNESLRRIVAELENLIIEQTNSKVILTYQMHCYKFVVPLLYTNLVEVSRSFKLERNMLFLLNPHIVFIYFLPISSNLLGLYRNKSRKILSKKHFYFRKKFRYYWTLFFFLSKDYKETNPNLKLNSQFRTKSV